MALSGAVTLLPVPTPALALELVAVTFNTGTTPSLDHDGDTSDGYTSVQAGWSDQFYGDGLAWVPAIDAAAAFFGALEPDVVAFQEIFLSDDCAGVPLENRAGFVCETWQPGDPTVAQLVLGSDYQIACNLGRPDKCLAVRKSFGSLRGCTGDFCLDGLDGVPVAGCGGGSRVGRGVVDLVGGGTLTLVNVHGTSGFSADDQDCRIAQYEQVFVDFDGEPAANGQTNLVLADLNVDPARLLGIDASADRLNELVPFLGGGDFEYVSEVGPAATPTFLGIANIDHVVSDVLTGSCVAPGVGGEPPVLASVYFDHVPIVCTVPEPGASALAIGALATLVGLRRRRAAGLALER